MKDAALWGAVIAAVFAGLGSLLVAMTGKTIQFQVSQVGAFVTGIISAVIVYFGSHR